MIAIIARSASKLVRSTLRDDLLLWAMFIALAVTTAWREAELVWLFVICGVVSMLIKSPPRMEFGSGRAVALLGAKKLFVGSPGVASGATIETLPFFLPEGWGVCIREWFGDCHVSLGGVVNQFHWLTKRQFLDAVAVAMITPGAIVITAGFIGYLVAGVAGALLAALAVFVPPLLYCDCGRSVLQTIRKK